MPQRNSDQPFIYEAFSFIRNKFRRFTKWVVDLFDTSKRAWEEHVPMTKLQAERMLRRGLPRGTKVSLDVDGDGSGSLSMDASYIDEVTKSFDLDKKVAYSGYMDLAKTGNGLGRKIMRNQIEFFIASGIEKLEMHAGLDAGGYTWARLGFLPYKNSLDELKSEIKQRYKKLAPLLDSREKSRLEKAFKSESPKSLWALADSRIDLAPKLREVFKAAANDDEKAQQLQENIADVIDNPNLSKPLPLGRVLLAGTSWQGELDFKNKAQMKRVDAYVGGLAAKPPAKPLANAR